MFPAGWPSGSRMSLRKWNFHIGTRAVTVIAHFTDLRNLIGCKAFLSENFARNVVDHGFSIKKPQPRPGWLTSVR